MARPKKENADYHTHDKEMRNDPKIRALRRKYKHEGYSVYNMMLEVLTGSDNWKYSWNSLNIELLSGDFDSENVAEIINYCIKPLGLFTIENGEIFSLQHQKRFIPLLNKRKRDINVVIATENPQSKVKYSIVEESKEGVTGAHAKNFLKNEKTKESEKGMLAGIFVAPEFDEVNNFFFNTSKKYWDGSKSNLVAQKFFNHYKSLKWKTAAGAQVEDWKALAKKWILDDLEVERKVKANVSRHTSAKPGVQDEAKTIAFVESIFTEYKAGTLVEANIPSEIYNFLADKELLIAYSEERANILNRCNGDEQLAKKSMVATYFDRLIKDDIGSVFQVHK